MPFAMRRPSGVLDPASAADTPILNAIATVASRWPAGFPRKRDRRSITGRRCGRLPQTRDGSKFVLRTGSWSRRAGGGALTIGIEAHWNLVDGCAPAAGDDMDVSTALAQAARW